MTTSYRNFALQLRIRLWQDCYCYRVLHQGFRLAAHMTTSSVPSVHSGPVRPGKPDPAGAGRRTYWPAIAGVAYLLAWTLGLAVWPVTWP